MTAASRSLLDRSDALRELSPTGAIRIAVNLGNPVSVKAHEDGRLSGPAPDVAAALARWTGLPINIQRYQSAAALMAADQDWDVAFLAADPAREDRYCFSAPYLTIEATLAVWASADIYHFEQADRERTRIGSVAGAAYDLALQRRLTAATRVVFASPTESFGAFMDRRIDAVAGIREGMVAALPDSGVRLLQDPFTVIAHCIAVPARLSAAGALVGAFVCERQAASPVANAKID